MVFHNVTMSLPNPPQLEVGLFSPLQSEWTEWNVLLLTVGHSRTALYDIKDKSENASHLPPIPFRHLLTLEETSCHVRSPRVGSLSDSWAPAAAIIYHQPENEPSWMSSSIEPSDHHSPANIWPPLNEKPQVRTAKTGSSYATKIIINSYFKLLCVRVICYTTIRTGTNIPLELLRPMKPKLGKKMLLFYVMQSSKSLGRVWWRSGPPLTWMRSCSQSPTRKMEPRGGFQALRRVVRISCETLGSCLPP